MKRTILFGLLCGSVLLANPVFANDAAQLQCEAQAAAKKLNGAAKTSFVGKCVKDAAGAVSGECEKAAADKKLAGAAKKQLHPEVREDGRSDRSGGQVREGGGRQEAGWRGQEQLCPEVREG